MTMALIKGALEGQCNSNRRDINSRCHRNHSSRSHRVIRNHNNSQDRSNINSQCLDRNSSLILSHRGSQCLSKGLQCLKGSILSLRVSLCLNRGHRSSLILSHIRSHSRRRGQCLLGSNSSRCLNMINMAGQCRYLCLRLSNMISLVGQLFSRHCQVNISRRRQ